MFSSILNWRTSLAAVAISIVIATVFYSNYLSKKIADDERKKVHGCEGKVNKRTKEKKYITEGVT